MHFPVKQDGQLEVGRVTVEIPRCGSAAIFPLHINSIVSEHAEVTG